MNAEDNKKKTKKKKGAIKEADKKYKPKDEYYIKQGKQPIDKSSARKRVENIRNQRDAPPKEKTPVLDIPRFSDTRDRPTKAELIPSKKIRTNTGHVIDNKPLRQREVYDKPKIAAPVGMTSGKAKRPKKNLEIPRCINCGAVIEGGLSKCPYCLEHPDRPTAETLKREDDKLEAYKLKHPEKFVKEPTPEELQQQWLAHKATLNKDVGYKSTITPQTMVGRPGGGGSGSLTSAAGKIGTGLINVGVGAAKMAPQAGKMATDAYNKVKNKLAPKPATPAVPKQTTLNNFTKAWEKYKLTKNRVDDEDEPLPPDYPNSNYQKVWEQMEDKDESAKLPKKRRGKAKPVEESEKEDREKTHLSNVMALTPEKSDFSRDEVSGISNSIKQAQNKPIGKPKTDKHIVDEDKRIKDQLNILWEDTNTKPMTTRPVNKNIIRMYGEPAEELPETVSPPPALYKTIEPTKKKGKS